MAHGRKKRKSDLNFGISSFWLNGLNNEKALKLVREDVEVGLAQYETRIKLIDVAIEFKNSSEGDFQIEFKITYLTKTVNKIHHTYFS